MHVAKARDEFYSSLGYSPSRLPVPAVFLCAGLRFALKYSYTCLAPPASDQAHTASLAFQGAYYAGMAVSAALFVWMVVRIVKYVRVANGIAG